MQRESQHTTGMFLEKIRQHKVVMLFLILGSVCLAIGTIFFMKIKGHSGYEIIHIIAFEAAIIFFTATIIETLLLKEFGGRAVEAMERIGKDTFALLRNAEYNGIIDILPPRRDVSKNQKGEEQGQLSLSYIGDALEKSKKVKIICVLGREFLWGDTAPKFYNIFSRKATEDYEVQILLASPNEYGAQIRVKRASLKNTDLLAYFKLSQRGINELNLKKKIIKVKYYNFIPQGWLVITDDKLFLEPYHMGDIKLLKDTWKEQFTDTIPWCGGRVPILVVKKPSTLYDAMDNYFDWLWKHDDPEIFNDEFKEYFNVEDDVATEEEQKSGQKIQ